MTGTSLILYGSAVAIGYVIVANRLLVVGSHFRARALDLGTQLLEDDRVPDAIKATVEGWLCDVPRASSAWRFNSLLLPAVFMVLIARWRGKPITAEPGSPAPTAPYWETWDDFTTMAIIAMLCNSPLALALGVAQALFAVSFVSGNYLVWGTVNRMLHKEKGFAWLHRHAH